MAIFNRIAFCFPAIRPAIRSFNTTLTTLPTQATILLMQITMFKSKIHRATVTEANLNYEGSVSICPILMEKAEILPYEQVHLWDIDNGNRLITYALKGKDHQICVNGAGARLIKLCHTIIIATFTQMEEEVARSFEPTVVMVNVTNRIKEIKYGS